MTPGFYQILTDPDRGAAEKIEGLYEVPDEVAEEALGSTAKGFMKSLRARRNEIKNRFRKCTTKACKDKQDALLCKETDLPGADKGDFVDPKTGKRAPAGDGMFVPKEGTPLDDALKKFRDESGNPKRVPDNDGIPDFSGFPPKGFAGPNGKTRSFEVMQSIPTKSRDADIYKARKAGAHRTDIKAAKAANKAEYGDTPRGGAWHHKPDGTSIEYVDGDVHAALSHQGGASMNRSPEF